MNPIATTRALLGAGLAAVALSGCGEKEEPEIAAAPTTTTTAPATEQTTGPAGGGGRDPGADPPASAAPEGAAETATEDPRLTARELAAARTVRAYVDALDSRDGDRVCALLAPGALAELPLPEARGSCAASMDASIGYRDPRGLPVWDGAKVTRVRVIDLGAGADEAKVVATVVSEFADRDEPSVEDDVVYLVGDDGRWLVAKPSATLYRAVGIADVPPTVLSPPN